MTRRLSLITAALMALLVCSSMPAGAQTATPTATATASKTATPTATVTVTPTPTLTVTATPTPTPGVPRLRQKTDGERAHSPILGDPDRVAPRPFALWSNAGSVTTGTGVAKVVFGNALRLRGVILYATTVTTSGTATLKVGTATVATGSFFAGVPSYLELPPTPVAAGVPITLDVTSNGLAGATVTLDTIP